MSARFLGIDLGTSGVRAALTDADDKLLGLAREAYADDAASRRDPAHWWAQLCRCLDALGPLHEVRALAVDGTSGTVLPVRASGRPLAPAALYCDRVTDPAVVAAIDAVLPQHSAARGGNSALSRMLDRHALFEQPFRWLHQADWVAGCLINRFDFSDESNALKSGYDPIARSWPEALQRLGLSNAALPKVVPCGTPLGTLSRQTAQRFGFKADTEVISGFTDGCAAFFASGAANSADAVTSLGTTLTLKLLSNKAVFDARHGIYSHRVGEGWLAGGASNSGGQVIDAWFDRATLERLSASIDPSVDTGLDYYPLLSPGERFPHADEAKLAVLTPRPDNEVRFLHGLLEGIARIEAEGYRQLAARGAPPPRRIFSVGSGALNAVWQAIRERQVSRVLGAGVSWPAALSSEAAVGSARWARRSWINAESNRSG